MALEWVPPGGRVLPEMASAPLLLLGGSFRGSGRGGGSQGGSGSSSRFSSDEVSSSQSHNWRSLSGPPAGLARPVARRLVPRLGGSGPCVAARSSSGPGPQVATASPSYPSAHPCQATRSAGRWGYRESQGSRRNYCSLRPGTGGLLAVAVLHVLGNTYEPSRDWPNISWPFVSATGGLVGFTSWVSWFLYGGFSIAGGCQSFFPEWLRSCVPSLLTTICISTMGFFGV